MTDTSKDYEIPTLIFDELVLEHVRVFKAEIAGWYEFTYGESFNRDIRRLEKGDIVLWPDDHMKIRKKS